ncbi:MAG: type II secretion system F family protein [Planctomycetota bacterium]|nr:type II secretion system F family protein [Planctomycetota bacterium]
MKLVYEAFDKTGRQCTDVIEAADATAAGETLRHQGLYVTKLTMRGAPVATRRRWSSKSKRLKNVAMLSRQLHSLVSCGTPLVEAMAAFERQARPGPWQDAMKDLRLRVEQGSPLSVAMENHPQFFDPVVRSLIGAGESSGNLPAMLERVAQITRKQLAVRNAVVGAMVYPAVLAVVAVSVLVLMLLFVIPRFGELFKSLNATLPPTTQALLTLSEGLQAYWWAVLIGTVIPAVGLKMWLGSENGRRSVQTIILRLPQIGRMARSFATARLTRVLGMLLESHVSVLDALSLTRESIGNHHYAALIARAEEAVTQGKNIHVAFADTDLISPGVCEAIRSGEQSGQVGQLLVHIADFLDEDNEVVVKSLTSIIEPVILVVMGLLVGTIAVSMFLPLFDLTSMTKGG